MGGMLHTCSAVQQGHAVGAAALPVVSTSTHDYSNNLFSVQNRRLTITPHAAAKAPTQKLCTLSANYANGCLASASQDSAPNPYAPQQPTSWGGPAQVRSPAPAARRHLVFQSTTVASTNQAKLLLPHLKGAVTPGTPACVDDAAVPATPAVDKTLEVNLTCVQLRPLRCRATPTKPPPLCRYDPHVIQTRPRTVAKLTPLAASDSTAAITPAPPPAPACCSLSGSKLTPAELCT
jgi:hypothetical protein